GRPDLAAKLDEARAPTLLIVGGADEPVLALNRQAQQRLGGPSRLAVVPAATHLFEEPGALERVARLAIEWLGQQLGNGGERPAGPTWRRGCRRPPPVRAASLPPVRSSRCPR